MLDTVEREEIRAFLARNAAVETWEGFEPIAYVAFRVGQRRRDLRKGPESVPWHEDVNRLAAVVCDRIEGELDEYKHVDVCLFATGESSPRARLKLTGTPAPEIDDNEVPEPKGLADSTLAWALAKTTMHTNEMNRQLVRSRDELQNELAEAKAHLLLSATQLQAFQAESTGEQIRAVIEGLAETFGPHLPLLLTTLMAGGDAPPLPDAPADPAEAAVWMLQRVSVEIGQLAGHLFEHQLAAWPKEPEVQEQVIAIVSDLKRRIGELEGLVGMARMAAAQADVAQGDEEATDEGEGEAA